MNPEKRAYLIGPFSVDENTNVRRESYRALGGPVYYAGRFFTNFGLSVTICALRGEDIPSEKIPWARLVPDKPVFVRNLSYQITEHEKGERELRARFCESGVLPDITLLKEAIEKPHFLMIAPLLPNMQKGYVKAIRDLVPETLIALLPQGLYRHVENSELVTKQDWNYDSNDIAASSLIIFSEMDMEKADNQASIWSEMGPLVVVTKGENGCTIYQKGQKMTHVAAYKINFTDIRDSTGCGDLFAGAFVINLLESNNVVKAAEFAHAVAGLSLKFTSKELQLVNPKTVENFIRLYSRR
jgi:hypothetical protein